MPRNTFDNPRTLAARAVSFTYLLQHRVKSTHMPMRHSVFRRMSRGRVDDGQCNNVLQTQHEGKAIVPWHIAHLQNTIESKYTGVICIQVEGRHGWRPHGRQAVVGVELQDEAAQGK